MKVLLLSLLALTISTSAALANDKRTVQGNDAQTLAKALAIVAGNNETAKIQIVTGSSQEGEGNDNVTAIWTDISGDIGGKSVECSTQEYMTYKVARKNKANYINSYECTIQ